MKAIYRTVIAFSAVLLLAACAPQAAATPPTSATQAGAAPETAAATVWFDGRTCGYEGPETLPAGDSIPVAWDIRTKAGDIYQLYPIVSETSTANEDVLKSLAGLDAAKPVFPDGLVGAGAAKSVADRKVNVVVKRPDGPLKGFLYFSCWDTDTAFQVLGPIELK